ncbi:hypothetical protein E0H22_06660 [Rhodopseudomonas boonkerdii]|uniref:hypothetical protein n=1 Tax=Rhodopseudomonas boonkerdii TaxID=475937 RepID=UPI001E323D13|nr:hypothetical protein [Rhodopseudomonas boonkerdii]UGV25388.1 hypothetical protein E0H22_06660 [Rhodopseudomonas boonkerdii]
MITWADVNHIEEPAKVPYLDGILQISHKELAVWKEHPNAIFRTVSRASVVSDGRVVYLISNWDLPTHE